MKQTHSEDVDFETIAADVAKLRADLERLTDQLKQSGGAGVTQAISEAAGQAGELEEVVEGVVKAHPLTSVVVAAAIGLVAGTMLRR